MIQYPLEFKVNVKSSAGVSSAWESQVPAEANLMRSLVAAIPPEFEGPGGGYSPEDFYALALSNCFVATFKVIAERSKLEYQGLEVSGLLTVDRNEKGAPWMKHFLMKIKLKGATDQERGLRLLEKTSQSCLVLNSVKTEKTFQFEVS